MLNINDQLEINGVIYTIIKISGEIIWVTSSENKSTNLLVPINGEYHLYQSIGSVEVVKYLPKMAGDPYLDELILTQLSDPDLMNFCRIYPEICLNHKLWIDKIYDRFGLSVTSEENPQNLYWDLAKMVNLSNINQEDLINYLDLAAIQGNFYLLEFAKRWGYYPNKLVLQQVLETGNPEITNWLLNNLQYTSEDYELAKKLGYDLMINKLEQMGFN